MADDRCNDGFPALMTESELIDFLRIPLISKAVDHHNVIENLRRMRGLPVLHLCRQRLFWRPAIAKWIEEQLEKGQ